MSESPPWRSMAAVRARVNVTVSIAVATHYHTDLYIMPIDRIGGRRSTSLSTASAGVPVDERTRTPGGKNYPEGAKWPAQRFRRRFRTG
jgi:hypothetical protein